MALSGNVRYQFVCQKACVFFVCWLVPPTRLPAMGMGSARDPEQVPLGLQFTGHHTLTQAYTKIQIPRRIDYCLSI